VRITFLFVTHDQEEAIAMSDRICVMNHGRIEQIGAPDEIYYRPRTRFVATFFGDNNLLPGTKAAGGGIASAFGPLCSADPRLAALADGASLLLAVRPEALRLETVHTGAGDNRLPVTVRAVDFVGPTSRVQVASPAAPDQPLLVKVTSRLGGIALRPGDEALLTWAAADCATLPDEPPP
jgi:ABC-type Fe3+/spermidine/putrescine transport system ATPase subunit